MEKLSRATKAMNANRERTLLIVIAALAEKSGIDLGERGAAQRIAEATDLTFAGVSEKTIRETILPRIRDAMEARGT